jgi:hypothetical protein
MRRVIAHGLWIACLTVLTQLGGAAWLLALCFRRRIAAFLILYAGLWAGAMVLAPYFGRVPLSCTGTEPLRVQSVMYCAMNRHYVTPEMKQVLVDFSQAMEQRHNATETLVLDANFPFLTGFPLLPHLSHHDGEKADLAFYYKNHAGYLPGKVRSPIGYFAFEEGPTTCLNSTLSLRWDLLWMQNLWPDFTLDEDRMATALSVLSNDERIGKIFIEPHLKKRFAAHSPKIRFQGCRAARHDDHIHIQL